MRTGPRPRPFPRRAEPVDPLTAQLHAAVQKKRQELASHVMRAERREQLERDVRQEMTDFFEESARNAAMVVSEITRNREARINERIEREVRDFFAEALEKASRLVERLRLDRRADPSVVVEELEAVLRGVAGAVQRAARGEPARPIRPVSGGRKPAGERASQRIEPDQPRRRPGESRGQR